MHSARGFFAKTGSSLTRI